MINPNVISGFSPTPAIDHPIFACSQLHTICLIRSRYGTTRAVLIALVCTFIDAFNIPVFWPILVMYFIILFVLTMKRQIKVNRKSLNSPWKWNSISKSNNYGLMKMRWEIKIVHSHQWCCTIVTLGIMHPSNP